MLRRLCSTSDDTNILKNVSHKNKCFFRSKFLNNISKTQNTPHFPRLFFLRSSYKTDKNKFYHNIYFTIIVPNKTVRWSILVIKTAYLNKKKT
jgi:hypothetical protein